IRWYFSPSMGWSNRNERSKPMARTIVGLFDVSDQAQQAVQDLIENGVRRDDIEVVADDARSEYTREAGARDTSKAGESAGFGSVRGGVFGSETPQEAANAYAE